MLRELIRKKTQQNVKKGDETVMINMEQSLNNWFTILFL